MISNTPPPNPQPGEFWWVTIPGVHKTKDRISFVLDSSDASFVRLIFGQGKSPYGRAVKIELTACTAAIYGLSKDTHFREYNIRYVRRAQFVRGISPAFTSDAHDLQDLVDTVDMELARKALASSTIAPPVSAPASGSTGSDSTPQEPLENGLPNSAEEAPSASAMLLAPSTDASKGE